MRSRSVSATATLVEYLPRASFLITHERPRMGPTRQRPVAPHERPAVRARRGFALEAALLILVLFSLVIIAGLSAVTTMARTSNADYLSSRASYAAEGGADDIMSQLPGGARADDQSLA